MSALKIRRKQNFHNDDVISILRKIREGNQSLRTDFINENDSIILKVVSQTLGKSTIAKNSKEYGIGFSALNFAIDNFDLNSKDVFWPYAEQIIKDWTIDEFRSAFASTSSGNNNIEKDYILFSSEDKELISQFKLKLWEFGISLKDLITLSPGDDASILMSLTLARTLANNPVLYKKLITNKSIPINDLDERFRFQKKLIEKYKNYIITLCLMQKSELKIPNSYLKNIENGKGSSENLGITLELYQREALVFTFQGRFSIIKVRSMNDMVIGKQIQVDKYSIKTVGSNKTKYMLLSAAAIVILAAAVTIPYLSSVNREDKYASGVVSPIVSDEGQEANYTEPPAEPTQIAVVAAVDPTPVIDPDEIQETYVEATEDSQEIIDNNPVKTPDSQKKNTPKPTRKTQATKKPTRTPVPTKKQWKASPTPAIVHYAANGVPEKPEISADSYSVKVGSSYTIYMNTGKGNNAKSLILYENDEVISVKQLKDLTPAPQSGQVTINAKYAGMYKYKWELVNDYGTTSSSSIWINVVER